MAAVDAIKSRKQIIFQVEGSYPKSIVISTESDQFMNQMAMLQLKFATSLSKAVQRNW